MREHGLRFLQERYWTERQFFKPWFPSARANPKCEDKNGVIRKKHALDKDGRCIFCNWLKP